jgi:glutathionyl-hydroquinone reductase
MTAPASSANQTGPAGRETSASGQFVRQANAFRERITADGSSGYPAEPGRYHLYVSLACPWAHRSIIVRRLKGLEDVVSMSVVDPIRDAQGWAFREGPGHGPDPVNGFQYLSEAYLATDPNFQGRYTVPCVWDRETGRIVTNDYPDISLQIGNEFAAFATRDIDLYPVELRDEIDAMNELLFHNVNNGVYKAGFATTQAAYEEAFDTLFATLDELDARLATQRYLVGNQLTEADIRFFATLVRFDVAYHGHFKCNLRRIIDYPNLWPYARDIYQYPGIAETVDFDHIKRHYYMTHPQLNPTRIVPKGPALDWLEPHGREGLR